MFVGLCLWVREIDRQTDRQADRQTELEAERKTGRQRCVYVGMEELIQRESRLKTPTGASHKIVNTHWFVYVLVMMP